MESIEVETYEMPPYSNVLAKLNKSEGKNQILQKTAPGIRIHSLMKVAFKVVCIGLLITIVVLITSHTKDSSAPLQMSQANEQVFHLKSIGGLNSNQTAEVSSNLPNYEETNTANMNSSQTIKANSTTEPTERCYYEEKNGLCTECADDERCFRGCYGELLSVPACLAYQKEDCDLVQEYSNIHNYFTPPGYPDDRDSGRLQYVAYPKRRNDTGIRIQFNVNTNAHNGSSGCNRWFVKLNSLECSNPATIEMIDSSVTPQLLSRNMDMDGICYGIAGGVVNIEIWIDSCFTSANALTAWLGARQLTIMEVLPLNSLKGTSNRPCSHLIHFNLRYESWLQSGESTFNTKDTTILIKAVSYYKLASDSALRIKYQAAHSVLVDQPDMYSCAKWFIEVNGTLCSPHGDFLIYPYPPNNYDYYRYHSRTRTLECICENKMPAGPVLIEVKVGKCFYHESVSHVKYGDLHRPSRILIEEVRLNKSTDAILGLDGTLYNTVVANIVRFHWHPLNSPMDNGDILSVTYTKRYSSTALKLTSSGDHRTVGSGCARWFFKINGAECGNPGVIDAVSADFYPPNVHQPMQATGHCYGLPAGTYTIAYSVSNCPGYAVADYYTGWGSSFNVFIEEVRLDYMKYCYGASCN